MFTSYQISTWKCDVTDCPNEISLFGSPLTESEYLKAGWYSGKMMDDHMDMCPDHHKELREFFFGVSNEEEME